VTRADDGILYITNERESWLFLKK